MDAVALGDSRADEESASSAARSSSTGTRVTGFVGRSNLAIKLTEPPR